MPNSPVQPLIGKSGRLYICVVVCLVVRAVLRHGGDSSDVTLAFEALKLSFNFCNVLDRTGLDLTGTMVDLPDAMLDLPDTMVDLPDTMLDLPDTMVDLPDTMVDLSDPMVNLPDTMADLLDNMVDLPDTMIRRVKTYGSKETGPKRQVHLDGSI